MLGRGGRDTNQRLDTTKRAETQNLKIRERAKGPNRIPITENLSHPNNRKTNLFLKLN